jgi:flagellar secretion chaperone FliS
MATHKPSQYQAYSLATRTVAKTRQVVMLYDGAIRFLRQAEAAIAAKRIEERFKLLQRASEVIVGLQSSIDFDSGGEVAVTLHRFYSGISMRILSVNFKDAAGAALCAEIITELKQMRDIWDSIDRTLNKPSDEAVTEQAAASSSPSGNAAENTVSLSA